MLWNIKYIYIYIYLFIYLFINWQNLLTHLDSGIEYDLIYI